MLDVSSTSSQSSSDEPEDTSIKTLLPKLQPASTREPSLRRKKKKNIAKSKHSKKRRSEKEKKKKQRKGVESQHKCHKRTGSRSTHEDDLMSPDYQHGFNNDHKKKRTLQHLDDDENERCSRSSKKRVSQNESLKTTLDSTNLDEEKNEQHRRHRLHESIPDNDGYRRRNSLVNDAYYHHEHNV